MKTPKIRYLLATSLVFFLLINNAQAEEINFSDPSTVNEIFAGKSLNCHMKELNYDGPETIKIINISGKKILGESTLWCHGKGTKYKGKLKKNLMKWSQTDSSAPCYCRSGSLSFTRNSDGLVSAKGHYLVGCGASPVQGTIQCTVD